MKTRKFADGEFVREGSNENIDDDTRARAMKFAEDGDSTIKASGEAFKKALEKPKVVTKEELAKSGLSLRDYMNKQQGLTRRGEDKVAAPSKASAAPKAAAPEPKTGPMSDEERATSMERIPRDKGSPVVDPVTGSDLSRNISTTLNAAAGLKGVQMGQLAAEAAMGTRAGKALSGLMGGKKAAEVRKIEPTMSNVSAAKRAELAGELRRGVQPTKFTSPKKNPKNTRKFEDETGVEFRKGGNVKGWGQARGARSAKIY